MAIEDNNRLSITVEQSLLGEDVLNIFYYVFNLIEAGVVLFDLLSEFETQVCDKVRLGQVPEVVTNNFVGRNLTNGVDIEVLNSGDLGLDGVALGVLGVVVLLRGLRGRLGRRHHERLGGLRGLLGPGQDRGHKR